MKLYKIYKLTCIPTNKIYIGTTSQPIHRRFRRVGDYAGRMKKAIEKYGVESFTHEIIEEVTDQDKAFERESYYIQLFDSTNPKIGYNTCKYKSGHSLGNPSRFKDHHHTEESKIKTSHKMKGIPKSKSTIEKMTEHNAMSIKVICIENCKSYSSLTKAAKDIGSDRHTIAKYLNTDRAVKGFHFKTINKEVI